MKRSEYSILFSWVFLVVFSTASRAEEKPFGETPYRIKICLFADADHPVPGSQRDRFVQSVDERSRTLIGPFWQLDVEFLEIDRFDDVSSRFSDPPAEWEHFDKIYLVRWNRTSDRFGISTLDVRTRWTDGESFREIDLPEKTVDVLIQALAEHFTPVVKLERAGFDSASFRIQAIDVFSPSGIFSRDPSEESESQIRGGISIPGEILLPFVRTLDREGKTMSVSRIPWTAIRCESFDPLTKMLRGQIESSQRDPLGVRRRGRTEIYAISVPTPMRPTEIRLFPRMQAEKESFRNTTRTMPIYDVLEIIPEEKLPVPLTSTRTDGSFVLQPVEERPIRMILLRSGPTAIARFPVIRGLEKEYRVPIPDDPVRLEAEAAILGIQEELLDTTARRKILEIRLKQQKDSAKKRETQNEWDRLKSFDQFLTDLRQARLRFETDDPIVRRRIEKMFRDTEKAIREISRPKPEPL